MSDAERREAARQARNAYHREWRAKNKDKVKANNDRYWEKKAEQLQEEAEKEECVNAQNEND